MDEMNEMAKLSIVDGPDRFRLAMALVEQKNVLLRFEAANYNYLMDATISVFERQKSDQIKLTGVLQHADGIAPADKKNSRYNFSGVYSCKYRRGEFFVEGLSGDGFVEKDAPSVDSALADESIKCIDTLKDNLSSIAQALDEKKEDAKKSTLSMDYAAVLNQEARFIERTASSLMKVREIVAKFAASSAPT